MKSVAELIQEVINDENYDLEQATKQVIKALIRDIVKYQGRIAEAVEAVQETQVQLRELESKEELSAPGLGLAGLKERE